MGVDVGVHLVIGYEVEIPEDQSIDYIDELLDEYNKEFDYKLCFSTEGNCYNDEPFKVYVMSDDCRDKLLIYEAQQLLQDISKLQKAITDAGLKIIGKPCVTTTTLWF
jgi:histidinol phosphatase-like PHP family hydrolase